MAQSESTASPPRLSEQGGESLTYLVANFNQAAYVEDCLTSLAEQTDGGWWCLLCDDASTDDSLEVIRSSVQRLGIAGQIRIICNEHNLGYIGTLRRLISESATDIVAILDPDDAIEPETTAVLREVYAADPQVEFAFSRMSLRDVNMQPVEPELGFSERPQPGKTLLMNGHCSHIKSFRQRAYLRTEGYDDRCLYAEDRDLLYKLEEVTHPVFIDRVLYRYRRFVPGAQSHDPAKTATMYRSSYRGRSQAVRRRLRGWHRWFARFFFYLEFKSSYIRGVYRLWQLLGRLRSPWHSIARAEQMQRVPPPKNLPPYCMLCS